MPLVPEWSPAVQRVIAALAVYVAVYMVIGALTNALFIHPPTDQPRPADAIVVPQGEGGRVEAAVSLARAGYAPVLAVAASRPGGQPCPRALDRVRILCFRPDPYSTQGEARWVAATARALGWRSVLIVASNTQDLRIRFRVSRCYHGAFTVLAVRVGPDRVVRSAAYEWGALLKAVVLQPTC